MAAIVGYVQESKLKLILYFQFDEYCILMIQIAHHTTDARAD